MTSGNKTKQTKLWWDE